MIGDNFTALKTIDMHTGGEPVRIILEGYPKFEQQPILAVRRALQKSYDHLRKALMWEPRGHADMYGLLRVQAEREDSAFGVIFMHNEGYSTMCGHATIAIGKAAVDLGWVEKTLPVTRFKIDAPCGQLDVSCEIENGEVTKVSFLNVPSFYVGNFETNFDRYGKINYDLAYGGAFYAYADVDQFGLKCLPSDGQALVALGRKLKAHVQATNQQIKHPREADLSFLYGCIFREDSDNDAVHSRNVCIFADGELDRSATGSGVSGRAAILHAKGLLDPNQAIRIESLLESYMDVEIQSVVNFEGKEAIIPKVSGIAYYTGKHEFWIDDHDPLKGGFLIR